MNTEDEEGQLSPRGPLVPSASPPHPDSPTFAPGPLSLLQSAPRSGFESLVYDSPSKKKKIREVDPADSPNKKTKKIPEDPVHAGDVLSSPSLLTSWTATPAVDEEGEDPFPFGSFSFDEEETARKTKEGKGSVKKKKQDKKLKKDEQLKTVVEQLDPESPPGLKLPRWKCVVPDPEDALCSYIERRIPDPADSYIERMLEGPHAHSGGKLNIDILDLLSHNAKLACAISNVKEKAEQEWLNSVVESALEKLHDKNAQPKDVVFVNKPDCLYSLKDILDSHKLSKTIRLFKGSNQVTVEVPTSHAKKFFRLVLEAILWYTQQRWTWDGQLSVDDIYCYSTKGIMKIRILKDPTNKNVTNQQLLLDIESIWSKIISPCFDGETLPLYFSRLKVDLMGAEEHHLTSAWFYDYLIYHPVFSSPTARRNFIVDVQLVSKSCRFIKKSLYRVLFEEAPKDNWFAHAENHPILNITFNYRKNLMRKPTIYRTPYEVIIEESVSGVTTTKIFHKPTRVTVLAAVGGAGGAKVGGAGGAEVGVAGGVEVEVGAGAGGAEVGGAGGAENGGAGGVEVEVAAAAEVEIRDAAAAVEVEIGPPVDVRGSGAAFEVGGAGAAFEVGCAGAAGDVRAAAKIEVDGVGAEVEGEDVVIQHELLVGERDKEEEHDEEVGYEEHKGDLVRFVKNSIFHIPDNKKIKLLTVNDPEILNASVFSDLVPDLTKGIAEAITSPKEDSEYHKRFAGLWAVYKSSIDLQEDHINRINVRRVEAVESED